MADQQKPKYKYLQVLEKTRDIIAEENLEIEDEVAFFDKYKETLIAEQLEEQINNDAEISTKIEELRKCWVDRECWPDTLEIVAENDNSEVDFNDDLKREMAFYMQAMDAFLKGRDMLEENGIKQQRPDDYFAQMVKPDWHMAKVKDVLLATQRRISDAQERKKKRQQKLYGKQMQRAVESEKRTKRKLHDEALYQYKQQRKGLNKDLSEWDAKQALEDAINADTRSKKRRGKDKKYGGKGVKNKTNTFSSYMEGYKDDSRDRYKKRGQSSGQKRKPRRQGKNSRQKKPRYTAKPVF